MNYQEMDEVARQQARQEVNQRAIELKSVFRNLILSVATPLLYLNSGGVIALLLYRFLSSNQAAAYHLKVSLFSFTFGIVAAAMALMFLFMRTSKVESSFAVDRDLFFNNQLSLDEFKKNDGERCESDNVEYMLVLLASIAFISGVLYGVFNFV